VSVLEIKRASRELLKDLGSRTDDGELIAEVHGLLDLVAIDLADD
jgi:hypothetical protein